MEKYLKYYNEVQIMRNGMEQVKTTNGFVKVEPVQAFAGENKTVVITYTVGEEPICIGGVLKFTIPFGFTRPQIDMPIFPAYTTAHTTRKNASVETFIKKMIGGKEDQTEQKRRMYRNMWEHTYG